MKLIWAILWKSCVFFILWALFYSPFVVGLALVAEEMTQGSPLYLRLFFDTSGVFAILLAAWVMARFVDHRSFTSLGFASKPLVRDGLSGASIGFVWLALSLLVLSLFGMIIYQPTGSMEASTLMVAALSMILNTVIQEVLSRGYVFQTIHKETNATWAILITTIIFVLYHAGGLQGAWLPAINVFGAGLLFGVAFYVTGNLWLPIAIHFVWNFLLGTVLGLAVSGQNLANSWHFFTLEGPVLFTGGDFGVKGSLIVTLITVLGIIALLRWYPRPSPLMPLSRVYFKEIHIGEKDEPNYIFHQMLSPGRLLEDQLVNLALCLVHGIRDGRRQFDAS